MSLRIRQIVVAARDLEKTVEQLTHVLGVKVCYRDPAVAKFGLVNALMTIGDQFLEVVSPTEPETAAGRHLERFGDSGYMLILQTDDLAEDRARIDRLGIRIVWESVHPEISAIHLHPKDIGAAIVSLDQPVVPAAWPWAGEQWTEYSSDQGAQQILTAKIEATEPVNLAEHWALILGAEVNRQEGDSPHIPVTGGRLDFESASGNALSGFTLALSDVSGALDRARELSLPVSDKTVTICGTEFTLLEA